MQNLQFRVRFVYGPGSNLDPCGKKALGFEYGSTSLVFTTPNHKIRNQFMVARFPVTRAGSATVQSATNSGNLLFYTYVDW